MALHPEFPQSPYAPLVPEQRWFPAAEELRSTVYEKLLPPLVAKIRTEVAAWRDRRYEGASDTSRALLNWWFENEHLVEQADGTLSPFRYYFAQREAVETVIWLHDVRRVRDKFDLLRFDASGRDDFQLTLHIQDDVRAVRDTGNLFLTNIHRVLLGDLREPSLEDEDLRDYFLAPFGPRPIGKTTDSKTDLGEIVREIDELAVFNDEAHHIHDPKMARLKQWCADATRASQAEGGPAYRFVYVDQEGFQRNPPSNFAGLLQAFRDYQD